MYHGHSLLDKLRRRPSTRHSSISSSSSVPPLPSSPSTTTAATKSYSSRSNSLTTTLRSRSESISTVNGPSSIQSSSTLTPSCSTINGTTRSTSSGRRSSLSNVFRHRSDSAATVTPKDQKRRSYVPTSSTTTTTTESKRSSFCPPSSERIPTLDSKRNSLVFESRRSSVQEKRRSASFVPVTLRRDHRDRDESIYDEKKGGAGAGTNISSDENDVVYEEIHDKNGEVNDVDASTTALETGHYRRAEALFRKAINSHLQFAEVPLVQFDYTLDPDAPPQRPHEPQSNNNNHNNNNNDGTDQHPDRTLTILHMNLARALAGQRRYADSLRALHIAESHLPPSDPDLRTELHLHIVDVCTAAGDLDEADRRCWRAMRDARRGGQSRNNRLYKRAIEANVRVLQMRGEHEEAEAYAALLQPDPMRNGDSESLRTSTASSRREPSGREAEEFWSAWMSREYNRMGKCIAVCPSLLESTSPCKSRSRVRGGAKSITPIHVAVDAGLVDVVRLLVSQGADINVRDPDGWRTCIHKAVMKRESGILRLLLEAGANVDAKTATGETALHIAAAGRSQKILDLLLAHHADVESRDGKDHTPLYVAVYYDRVDMADRLLNAGADVNGGIRRGETGFSPLHRAAIEGFADVAKVLIDHGARVNQKDSKGRTPMFCAVSAGNTRWNKVEKVLRKHGGVG